MPLTPEEKKRARELYIEEGYTLSTLADFYQITNAEMREILGRDRNELRRLSDPELKHIRIKDEAPDPEGTSLAYEANFPKAARWELPMLRSTK